MKELTTKDVLYSVYAAETEHDAIKILDRYVEHLVKQQKADWVAEIRAKRQKKLDESGFTNAIDFLERTTALMKPNHHDILKALRLIAEAFREREDSFYRRPPQ